MGVVGIVVCFSCLICRFANNWEDFFKNAYCVVDGTKIKVGNVVIGNTSYFAEFSFNPQTLSYQFSDYAVQNDDDSFLSIKDLYSKAFSIEVVDSNSPELAEFQSVEGPKRSQGWPLSFPLLA